MVHTLIPSIKKYARFEKYSGSVSLKTYVTSVAAWALLRSVAVGVVGSPRLHHLTEAINTPSDTIKNAVPIKLIAFFASFLYLIDWRRVALGALVELDGIGNGRSKVHRLSLALEHQLENVKEITF